MRRPLHLTGVMLALVAAGACGDSGRASPAPAPGTGEPITGRERVGWTQPASGPGELALYRYALYVDGTRRPLEGESCAAEPNAAGFDCSAPLPALAPGRHTLELAAFVEGPAGPVEGTRSPPLAVTVTGSSVQAPTEAPESGALVSSDGVRLEAAILARDLDEPTDVTVAAGGGVFVAERNGRVRTFDGALDGGEAQSAAAEQNVLERLRDGEGATLLSIAAGPEFAERRLLYAAYLAEDRHGPALQIVRFRQAGSAFGEAAVIASLPVPEEATARIRFGPDRHLYVAVGAGREPDLAQDLSSAAGKIIRLRGDGTRPDDSTGSSLVWSMGHRNPQGLAWRPAARDAWAVDRQDHGPDELNLIVAGGNYGAPVVAGMEDHPGAIAPALLLPDEAWVTGVAAIRATASPYFGDLILSSARAEDLFRVRVGPDGRPKLQARLLQGRFGRIRSVESASDGALYLVTANADTWGPARDMLVRLSF